MSSVSDDTSTGKATSVGQEPAMYLQRPSTGRSQDVRHILATVFRDLYTRESIRPETIRNLQVSKGGDDAYHERYVENLQKVYDEWTRRMEEAAMLERHIMQAQARAMSADERVLQRVSQSCAQFDTLGLPPGRAHFRSCIDTELLRDHYLLTPEDYSTVEPVPVPPPPGPAVPSYARETMSSQQHSRQKETESQPVNMLSEKLNMGQSLELPSFLSDLESIPGEQQVTMHTQGDEKFPSVNAWKAYMGTEERQEDRTNLLKISAKVDYMRNPRYLPPAESGNKTIIKSSKRRPKEINQPKPVPEPEEDAQVFIASPSEVVFRDYRVGQVYEITLELKNVSTVMRQCRAFPPQSSYFTIGLGQFPGDKGLVAPGMSCHFPVRFAPDSLKDYDDEIVLQTQAAQQKVVKVKGRRDPPSLTIPPVLDVGFCLVRGFQITQFAIANKGGPGRFCIMPRASWPATSFKSAIQNGSALISPFEIRPSTLELDRGQVALMEVMFKPTVIRSYNQEFTIVCDNCHVQHFCLRGEGQIVRVTLTQVERGDAEVQPGELRDRSAQHLIKFDDLNPFTYTERTITVTNHTNVELPFQWRIYKPQMTRDIPPPMDEIEGEAPLMTAVIRDPEEDRVPEVDSVFSVQLPNGVLEPLKSVDFKITFAPPVINTFHNVAHLLIQQVPPASQSRRGVSMDGSSTSLEENNQDELSGLMRAESTALGFTDMTALEIELKGQSIPLNVILHPYALYIPGSYLVGNTIKRLFTMANHSFSTITFQWEPVHNQQMILEVEPPFGELDPGMAMDLELSITGTEPGHISQTLFCYVLNLLEPLHLHVDTTIKGPEVLIDEPSLNFGLVRLGDTAVKEMTMRSLAQIVTRWTLQDRPLLLADLDDLQAESEFKFLPNSGELRPLEEKTIKVQFTPTEVKTVQRTVILEVENGNTVAVGIYAEVQQPAVCLLECELCLPEVYVGVPVIFEAVIFNQTLLATVFEWGKVEGSQAHECDLRIGEPIGGLSSREKHPVKMSFCPKRHGEYKDVRISCAIRGQKDLLYLNISCHAKSLSVKYRVSEDGEIIKDETSVSFGDSLMLGETEVRYVHIRNETAITADFTVVMELFNSAVPLPPLVAAKSNCSMRQMLFRTPSLADPLSNSQIKISDLKTAILGTDLGAAFLLQPSSGTLQPFGEQVIVVTSYSNMWGQYNDNIVSCVGDLKPFNIPISMTVHGCPLNFQMTAANPEQNAILRFGTVVAGTSPLTRQVRINNISPFDIRVDWRVYNQNDENNDRLLDFIVSYGRPFPQVDASGNEILPRTPEPPPIVRAPTEDIPDSPDTMSTEMTFSTRELFSTPKSTFSDSGIYHRDFSKDHQKKEHSKIISVFLRPHDGLESFIPYNITPRQLTIPAKGHASVQMTFTPPPVEECTQEMDCFSYALGYLSIGDVQPVQISGKVQRCEAFQAEQIRIDYTTHIKPALLTIEETDEEGMVYQSAMSDILNSGKLLSESLCKQSLMLSNTTQTPLTFRLKVNMPFVLVDLGGPGGDKTRVLQTDYHTLHPAHNIMVKVALKITPTLLLDYQNQQGCEALEEDGKLHINDFLIIEFNNTSQQRVPLKAVVAVPQMTLSKTELDFGTCLVGQRRELQLMISNTRAAHSQWTASFDSKSQTCITDTFQISPTHGMLEAQVTHISNSKTLLSVFFTAKHAEMYEAVILFQGMLGETSQRLYVRGCGSYDGKHEAVLNI